MNKTKNKEDGYKIDMWYKDKFEPMKYGADATFYPHGCFGYSYCGHIFDETGKMIGDYSANDSVWIEKNFRIEWR